MFGSPTRRLLLSGRFHTPIVLPVVVVLRRMTYVTTVNDVDMDILEVETEVLGQSDHDIAIKLIIRHGERLAELHSVGRDVHVVVDTRESDTGDVAKLVRERERLLSRLEHLPVGNQLEAALAVE